MTTEKTCCDIEWKKLRKEWDILHKNEDSANQNCVYQATFPDLKCAKKILEFAPDFRESFCPDGFITEYEKNGKTILFIAREANISENMTNGVLYPETTENFWMKNVWEGNCNDRFAELYREYIKHFVQDLETVFGWCEPINIAYMNLNKRGGFGKCNMSRLKHYAVYYKNLIQEEIKLIDPDMIICSGTEGTVKEIILKDLRMNKAVKVYGCYHPISSKRFDRFDEIDISK